MMSRRLLAQASLLAVAAAAPVAVSRSWGWLASLAVAACGGWLMARDLMRRYVRPVEELAGVVGPARVGSSGEDLARTVSSEYRDALARLADAQALSRRREVALAHAADAVVLLDPNGEIEYTNLAARKLLHERMLDVGKRLVEPQLSRLVAVAADTSAPVTEELTLRLPSARQVLARAVPLTGGGCVLVVQDLSEAYRLDRLRQDFVANVSHELKTPVAGIRALSDVARDAYSDGDLVTARHFVDRIHEEGVRLAELVADLLDLSKVESAQELHLEPTDVRMLLSEVSERVRTSADAKGIAMQVDGPSATVDADRSQLGMALQNLIDNAVRYSEHGTVRACVAVHGEWLSVAVSDQGIGIPSEELGRIFERFYRVDRARSRETGGTGLGLSIVRHVAENHGGRIEVHSEVGVGSTFTLYLPGPHSKGNAA